MSIEKNHGGRFGATSKTAPQIQTIYRENGPNGLNRLGTIQVLPQQRGGWMGSEDGNFLLIYSTIYADVGGWVGLKKQKKSYVTLEWSLFSQLDAATKLLWLGVIHKLKPETNFFQMYYFLKLF